MTAEVERLKKVNRLIRELSLGLERRCEKCKGKLEYRDPAASESPGVFCAKGCTHIRLDVSDVSE
jgi:hypothetical protein